MGARSKLNGAHLTGCILLAVVIGVFSGSLSLAIFAFLTLAMIDLVSGNIRTTSRRRRR